MQTSGKNKITVTAAINAPIEKVWKFWTTPEHIMQWNNASDDWHTTKVENDLHAGGQFLSRMEAKDGSFGFDFTGVYDEVKTNELISYTLSDGRTVEIIFTSIVDHIVVTEIFEAENTNSIELQKNGWQSILDNFKKYTEKKV